MLVASRTEIRKLLGRLEVRTVRPGLIALACVAFALAAAHLPSHAGLSDGGRWALFILLLAAALWVTEAIPAFAVGLLVIGLEVAILGRPGGPFATSPDTWKIFVEPWGSPLIWLFFGGFVLARGIANSGLDRWMSTAVLQRFGTRPRNVLLGAMGITFVFSMFTSNTATSAMMVAALAPVVANRKDDPFAKSLLLGVAFGANIGGMGSLIGTPPNAIAAGLLAPTDPIGFARWALFGLPPALVLLVVAWVWLLRRYPARDPRVDLSNLSAEPTDEPLPAWRRYVVIAVLLVTVALWLTEPLHGASPPVVAFVPVTVLTVTKVIRSEDIRQLDWDVLLLLAGGLALGVAVSETGLAKWAVESLALGDASPIVLAGVLALATSVLSNFMSNTATANIVIPMAIALVPAAPTSVAIPVALAASSAMCLPISTPPNAIAFTSGVLQTKDFIPAGIVIAVVGTILAVLWPALLLA